jgi:isocitrate dehydrogenase
VTVAEPTTARIEHVGADGTTTVLKDNLALQADEIVDGTFMSRRALVEFFEAQIEDARRSGVLFSLHLKATMMKVSDPIIFGHAVRTYFKPLFEKHGETFDRLGVDANQGFGDLVAKIATLPGDQRAAIEADIQAVYDRGPDLAMVDSDRGITNLHVPSDIIIDASMPVVVRDSGCMWNKDGNLQETKAVIPDRCYGGVYQVMLDSCRQHGKFDSKTMGSVPNVGLMAQKATARTTRPLRFPPTAPSAWSTPPGTCSLSTRSRRVTSGGPARSRTSRSATGSSSRSPAPGRPALRRSSGSTPIARTTRR